ncbi:MAG TPA: class I SAM-dependent methyltransferase, partial [Hyphomicrobium sp.]
MSDFSPEWLDLREAADARARNAGIANAVAARFALRSELGVLDLGSGTGSNLRATAPLLPARQKWNLVDRDTSLLDAAKAKLIRWSDRHEENSETLEIEKGGRQISVTFRSADLASDTRALLDEGPQLVTASA